MILWSSPSSRVSSFRAEDDTFFREHTRAVGLPFSRRLLRQTFRAEILSRKADPELLNSHETLDFLRKQKNMNYTISPPLVWPEI